MTRAQRYAGWARSTLSPRERLLPGLGERLAGRPRLAAGLLAAVRRVPGRSLRAAAERNVSRPLLTRMVTELDVRVPDGFRIRVDTTEAIGRALAVTGKWEPHVADAFRRLLSPGDVVIDIGANIGYHTLLAAKLVGPTGHVYAIEPGGGAFAALTANVVLNDLPNVTAHPVAAGAAESEAILDDRPWGHSLHSFVRREVESREPRVEGSPIRVRPVAAVVQPEHLARLRLIKIDVEGYDLEVLQGLLPLYAAGARPALVIELHLKAANPLPVLQGLSREFDLEAYALYDEDRAERSSVWLTRPVELSTASAFGREPHVLLLPRRARD
jgi:FkbM family methyltransferase